MDCDGPLMSPRSNQVLPSRLRHAVAILAGAAAAACLLGYWEWLFLDNIRSLVISGLTDVRSVSPQVRHLVLGGFGKRAIVGHMTMVSGLFCLVLMSRRRDMAVAVAGAFAVVLAVAICVLATLWLPVTRHAIPRSPSQWPNPHWDMLQLNACWLGVSLLLAILYCRKPLRAIPGLLIFLSAVSLIAVVGFTWTLASVSGVAKFWPGGGWMLRCVGETVWPFVLSATIIGVSADPIVRRAGAWLMVLAAATCPQLWTRICIEPWVYANPSGWWDSAGGRFDTPLHIVFMFIEIGLVCLIWSWRRGLLEPQEQVRGFPVVTKREDASA
jgi:hypothetical protein